MLLWFKDLMNVTENLQFKDPNRRMAIPKIFFRNRRKPITTSGTPDEREPATGFAVIPYIHGVTEPIKRILKSHNVKVAQKLF